MEQHTLQIMQERIRLLEQRLRFFLVAFGLIVILLVVLVSTMSQAESAHPEDSDKILRARGLVIVDDLGRERILIGAPIPPATNRVRTNLARVKETWAKRYPNSDQYMKYYQGYRHDTNGLLVLDENGFDRLAIGDPVPDPNIGKRIGPSTGMIINNDTGDERSGYGLLKTKEGYRVVLGMDSAKGEEGLTVSLHDDGPVGVMARDKDRMLFLGSAPRGDFFTGLNQPFQGLLLKKGKEVVHQLNVAAKK